MVLWKLFIPDSQQNKILKLTIQGWIVNFRNGFSQTTNEYEKNVLLHCSPQSLIILWITTTYPYWSFLLLLEVWNYTSSLKIGDEPSKNVETQSNSSISKKQVARQGFVKSKLSAKTNHILRSWSPRRLASNGNWYHRRDYLMTLTFSLCRMILHIPDFVIKYNLSGGPVWLRRNPINVL